MVFCGGLDEGEFVAEFGGEGLGAVAADGEATASLGPVESEGGDDGGSFGWQCCLERSNVELPIFRLGEEVEDGAIVPEVKVLFRVPGEDVGYDPVDLGCGWAEALFGLSECVFRDIKNGEGTVAGGEQVVDEVG